MTSLAEPSANGVVASNWRIGVHVTVLPATSSTEPLTTSGGNAVSSMTGHSESLHGCEPRERPEPETDGRARKVALSAFQSCNEIRALVFITPCVVRAWNSRSTASNRNVPQSGSTGVARADQSFIRLLMETMIHALKITPPAATRSVTSTTATAIRHRAG